MPSVFRPSPLTSVLRPAALTLTLLASSSAFAQNPVTPMPSQNSNPAQSDSAATTSNPGDGSDTTIPAAKPQEKQGGSASSPKSTAAHKKPSASVVASETSGSFLDQRVNLSDTHHVWHPSRKQLGLEMSDAGSYSVDSATLTHYLTGIAPYVRRTPQKARLALRGNHSTNPLSSPSSSVQVPAKLLPATPGLKLNVAGSVWKIKSALNADPETTHLLMSVQTTPAPSGGADLSGIDARLAHFVTRFNPGEVGRTQTVRLAIKLIDNHVIAPGDVFSVNQTVGERTAERGFGKGIVFVDGKQETQLGGGMCQVATTLYNAALLANLKIVQRYQHVRTVPYVKPGEDATVYWGQKDFKFENDTQAPIYISYFTTATHCICDIYGKATPGLKVSLNDNYKHVGPRHYTAVFKRYEYINGVKSNNYTAYSAYKWTPSLDYNI